MYKQIYIDIQRDFEIKLLGKKTINKLQNKLIRNNVY